ncbi:MAG: HAD family hydrolase [Microbacteriaceae bacterium]
MSADPTPPTLPPVDAVVFDVGGVLTISPLAAMASVAARAGLDPRLFARIAIGHGDYGDGEHPWHRLERGEIDVAEFDRSTDALARSLDLPGFPPLPGAEFLAAALALRADMADLPALVRQAGCRTAICTNNIRSWAVWREHVPIDGFEVIVDSCEVGMRKPEARIFQLVAERLGVPIERCVLLDDMAENVQGARAAGMQAIEVDHTDAGRRALAALLAGRLAL